MADKSQKEGEDRKKQYRDLLDIVSELQLAEETGPDVTDKLIDIIDQANLLFHATDADEQLATSEECLLDVKVVASVSDVLVNVAEAVDFSVDSYDYREFAKRIRVKYYDEEEGERTGNPYKKMMPFVNSLIKRVPNYVTYYGPAAVVTAQPPPPKKERKPKQKNEQAKAKKTAEKITQASQDESTVDDSVKFMMWTLNKAYEQNENKPINYYKFVLNPKCFTNSVENIFHVSFLVRDGRARLERDEVHNLWISPVSSKAANKGLPNKQAIISLDWTRWEQLCQKLKLEEPFLDQWKVLWEERRKK